ncbi:MAG TPA: hypothetical protein P5567_11740 [Kiritimatiellia bacterium]|nr:hypothetical protein [Kiritimatiellia bacterium]HRZ13112.1 hypothetical protein [Kiritimatiellia bacterium]HSA17533.1 hypothetical protein [Kiritimatiellia bacterium]
MKMQAAVRLLAGALALVGATARAGNGSDFLQLERDIPSLYLLNGLFLTPGQNAGLAARLSEMERMETEAAARVESLVRRYGDADALARLAGRNGGEGRMARPPPELKDIQAQREERERQVRGLAREVYGLLTPAQVEIIDRFTPCFIPPGDFRDPVRVGQAENHLGVGEPILKRLREVPEFRLDEARDRATEALTRYVLQKRRVKYSEEAEAGVRKEIETALDQELPRIRSLSDVDLELEKEDILCRLIPLEERPASTDEQLKLIGLYVLNPGCLDVVRKRANTPVPAVSPREASAPRPADTLGSAQRLKAVRLLAGLDLTEGQADRLLPVARSARDARAEVHARAEEVKAKALTDYRQLRAELADGNPTRETEQACQRWHQAVKTIYEQDLFAALRPYEEQAEQVLTANQSAMFAAAPNPPSPDQGGPMPARRQHHLALRTLEEARAMSPAQFQRDGADLADRFVRECVGQEPDMGVDIPTESERAQDVLEKARGMSQGAFRRQLRDLVAEMSPRRSAPRETAYGTKYDRGEPLPVLGPGAELLFTDAGVELLSKLAR